MNKIYKPLDLNMVLKASASIIGIPVKKLKVGRHIGDSKLTEKIDTAIELYVKYVLDNNNDNYDRNTIVLPFNGYKTKVTMLSKKFNSKGLSANKQYLYNELCKKIEEDGKA